MSEHYTSSQEMAHAILDSLDEYPTGAHPQKDHAIKRAGVYAVLGLVDSVNHIASLLSPKPPLIPLSDDPTRAKSPGLAKAFEDVGVAEQEENDGD